MVVPDVCGLIDCHKFCSQLLVEKVQGSHSFKLTVLLNTVMPCHG
jgi:hypothetical protein